MLNMDLSFLKRYMPASLFSRTALILILPLILLQIIVAVVFVQRHFEGVTRQMTRNIAREVAVAQQIIETSPTAAIAQLRLNNLAGPLAIRFDLDAEATLPAQDLTRWYDLSGQVLAEEVRTLLGYDVIVDLVRSTQAVDIYLLTPKGVLYSIIPRTRVTASNPHQLLVLMLGSALFLTIFATIMLRNQVKPILQLADASEAFGKGRSHPFRPSGAEEVRRAGTAFLSMRTRLERQMEQRTLMLSGVSHDLRTPLTRMKLALALLDEDGNTNDLSRDVSDMERMLDEFLAFARGDQSEDMVVSRPAAIVTDLAARMQRGGVETDFQIDGDEDAEVMMRESAIRRSLQNLLNNAAHYGDKVRLSVKLLPKTCEFSVEDNGPGIPVESREEVTRPFARLDKSRNQNKGGGVGLGLSIAQDVARSHGGALELSKSADLGGLRAVLRIPR